MVYYDVLRDTMDKGYKYRYHNMKSYFAFVCFVFMFVDKKKSMICALNVNKKQICAKSRTTKKLFLLVN